MGLVSSVTKLTECTYSTIPITIDWFYCHIFKFVFVTNFQFYFHFSVQPLKKLCFQTEILGSLFKYIYIFCFILLFTSSSPCRKDQFAVSYFSTILIVLIHGPVVRRPISANLGLNFNPGPFFLSSKAFPRTIFSILFLVANHQIVDKKN